MSANRQDTECVKCAGRITAFAGRPVSAFGTKYAHHPGQCADRDELERDLRQLAGQTTMFAASCRQIDPDARYDNMAVCEFTTSDRAAYLAHMKAEHGVRPMIAPKMIRLRKRPPAASLPALELVTTKWIRWTERTYSEWVAGTGQTCTERERRGQFWSLADDPHSVWCIPFPEGGRPQRPVKLYVANGRCYQDFSEARRLRREGNRRHGLAA
jgi:hypothetical protein